MKTGIKKVSSFITPLMVVLALLPMLAMSYIAYSIANTTLRYQIDSSLITLEKRKIENIDLFVRERKLDAFQISRTPILFDFFSHSYPHHLKVFNQFVNDFLKNSGFTDLVLVRADGQIIYSTYSNNEVGKNVAINPDYDNSFKVSTILMIPYISYTFDSQLSQRNALFIGAPVFLDSKLAGVLILSMNTDVLTTVIKNNLLDPSAISYAGMIREGMVKIFALSDVNAFNEFSVTSKHQIMEMIRKAANGEQNIVSYTLENNIPYIFVYRYLPELSMGLLTQYEISSVYSKVNWFKDKILEIALLSIAVVALLTYIISRRLSISTKATEKALLNVLPQKVIDEIKQYGNYKARVLQNVSVIFIDIVDYSKFSLKEDPASLTEILSDIYTRFDELSDKYQINKIKTIGDAYMAMGDLEDQVKNAENTIKFAIDCIKAVKIYNILNNRDLSIRVGINTGDVMAGVISAKKISYDIWGNTVNIAARFEKGAHTNQILLSQSTYDLLPDKEIYCITPENAVPCKGIGDIDAYSLDPDKIHHLG